MTSRTDPGGNPGLYRLLAWLSPAFPIGAFSYSHGLEAAVEAGAVSERVSLQAWVGSIVAQGSGRLDADIVRGAYHAAAAADNGALAAANHRGCAYRATAELTLESTQQGAAFLSAYEAAWRQRAENPSLPDGGRGQGEGGIGMRPELCPLSSGGREGDLGVCHAAAFGAAAARAGIALEDALLGYLQAFAANLVSAGLRLGVVGQTDGQRILAALEPIVTAAAGAALTRDPDDFGAATFAADLASMAHETQYTRLFRS